ncbi:hypothetical protein GGR57DRAFT_469452 [Xylariaceae sp. FL1272]|nr:hypothetical protein GGR57DRAFT_469452 [Xylariaceae sp. FL1272]
MEAINFPKFSLLPAELRLDIWEEAVREEATNRLVILIDTRVVPIKKLISPLLSVNRESRTRALKMYDTKLNIYRLPSPKPDRHWIGRRNEFLEWKRLGYPPPSQTPQFEGLDELLDELPDLDVFGDIFDDFFASSFKRLDDMDPFMLFHSDTEKIIHNIEERGTDSGTLYVSAEYDAFVITTGLRSLSSPDGITTRKLGFQDDLYALQPFYAEAVARLDKRSLGPELSWKHITSRLPSSTLLAVQTVILAESHCSTEYTYMDPVYETNTFSSLAVRYISGHKVLGPLVV